MMLHNPIRRVATAVLLAAMTLVLVPGLVLGHAELVTATPANDAVVDPVSEVSGIFSEGMVTAGSSLVVKNTSGATVASGTVDPQDDTRLAATPSAPLQIGTYFVEWTSVAIDGDIERGTWMFEVGVAAPPFPSASTPPSSTATANATAVPATPALSAGPTPSQSGDASSAGGSSDVVLPIIVALIVLGAGAVYLLTRRNRPTDPT